MTSTRVGPPCRPHVDAAAAREEVAALDELDAHEAREERVLEVRGVVDPGRQDDDRRVVDAAGSRGTERAEELRGVVADGLHAHADEELRERLRHDPAVRDDVGDAGRDADVVLEDAPRALLVPDEVDARDLDAHAVRGTDASGLPVEVG